MLVLNRRFDQELVIDGQIRVKVLSIKGNTVRLGIDAPRDVTVLRGELTKNGQRADSPPTIAEDRPTPPVISQYVI